MSLEPEIQSAYRSSKSRGSEDAERRVGEAIDAAGERIVRRQRRERSIRWMRIGFSAAALVFVSIAVIQLQYSQVSDRLRGNGATGLVPGQGTVLEAAPEVLRWPAQAGAESYAVVVRDARGALVLEVETDGTATSLEIPLAVRDVMDDGGTFLWSVTANSAVRQEIGPVWFEVTAD